MSSINEILDNFVDRLEKYPELKGHYKFDREGAYNELNRILSGPNSTRGHLRAFLAHTSLTQFVDYTELLPALDLKQFPIMNPDLVPVDPLVLWQGTGRLYDRYWQQCRPNENDSRPGVPANCVSPSVASPSVASPSVASPSVAYSLRQGQELIEAFICDETVSFIVLDFNGKKYTLPVINGRGELPAPIWTTQCPYSNLSFQCQNFQREVVQPNKIYKLGGRLNLPDGGRVKPFTIGPFVYTGDTLELAELYHSGTQV